MKRQHVLLIALLFLSFSGELFAQSGPDLASPARNFVSDTLRPLYPIIVSAVGLVGAMMNIGDIWGENKNWKGFLTKLAIYLGSVLVLVAAIEFINTLTINI